MNREQVQRVYDFQQIKQVHVTAVLERYGLLGEMKRIGAQLFGTCPIHRGTNKKQFVVDPAKNVWKCFGDCDRGGSTIELVSGIEGIEISAAADSIARWFAISSGTPISQHSKRKRSTMSGERPSHKVFVVEGEGDNAFWHRAGSAWPHKDGKGLNVQIPAGMALSGRVVLREHTEEDAKEEETQKTKRKK